MPKHIVFWLGFGASSAARFADIISALGQKVVELESELQSYLVEPFWFLGRVYDLQTPCLMQSRSGSQVLEVREARSTDRPVL